MEQIRKIIVLSRPIQLIIALMSYGLGLGLARYLGATILPEPQFFGGIMVIILMAASNLFSVYFRPPNEHIILGDTRSEREVLRSQILAVSLGFLAISATFGFLLYHGGYLNTESVILIFLFILLGLANAVPPIRFENRGLAELSTSIQISNLIPGIAFLFQFGSIHRLLVIFTFPLLLLAITYYLALNFLSYAEDLRYERKSLLIRLTWQRAVPIHDALIITSYLFFAATPFLGVAFALVWPALLTFPIAVYQMISLKSIADGGKPNWPIFIASATSIFGLTIYLVALTFWLH